MLARCDENLQLARLQGDISSLYSANLVCTPYKAEFQHESYIAVAHSSGKKTLSASKGDN